MNEFVAGDPWFAGWCGIMVNVSDVAAMGGRPIAVVDAVWSAGEAEAAPVLAGMRAASRAFGVPVVGGHTNIRTDRGQLSVAILGRAKRLLTSFDATARKTAWLRPSTCAAAIASRSRIGKRPPTRRRRGCAPISNVLPAIAEAGLRGAAKDISQGGIVGTAMMLAECSGVGATIDVAAVPRPEGVPLERWLLTFPSYGYLLAVAPRM